jgi:predicted HTH transcriptional regulator
MSVNVPVNVPVNLSIRQVAIIDEIIKNKRVSAKELAGILSVSEKTIKRDIAFLKKLEFIVRVGSDKTGEWEIIKNR